MKRVLLYLLILIIFLIGILLGCCKHKETGNSAKEEFKLVFGQYPTSPKDLSDKLPALRQKFKDIFGKNPENAAVVDVCNRIRDLQNAHENSSQILKIRKWKIQRLRNKWPKEFLPTDNELSVAFGEERLSVLESHFNSTRREWEIARAVAGLLLGIEQIDGCTSQGEGLF